jgi:hypothetical protein
LLHFLTENSHKKRAPFPTGKIAAATMPKTKIEVEAAPERPLKSQKLDTEFPVPLSMDDINDHCVLEIFKCLSVEELNSVAVFISKRYYELRNHDSLDQTRTGTIVFTESSTLDSIRNAFVAQGWNHVFTGNRTRLKVVGLGRTLDIPAKVERSTDYLLANVPCLDMSGTSSVQAETQEISSLNNIEAFAAMLPNLEELDLSY